MKRGILGFFLCFVFQMCYSQVECANKLLKEMAEQLSSVKFDHQSKEIMLPAICKGKPIIVECHEGVINHIGIKFFDRAVLAKHSTPIFYFIERYFLELLLLPTENEIKTKMHMDRVHVTTDLFNMTNLRKGLEGIAEAVSQDFSVYVTCNNNRYSASCLVGNKVIAKIDFPVRYELITGNTKLEAENSIYPALLVYKASPYAAPAEVDMYAYKDSLYCANEDYYVMEDIISTSFYQKKDKNFLPIFNSDKLEESIYNLFNTDYNWGVDVEVTQNLYGGKKLSYILPLEKLTNFLRHSGCLMYTGIRKYDKTTIEGVAMAVNMELGYQHMISFSFEKGLFDEPTKYKVKVKMYSYIPIHNVASLFGEKLKLR